MVFFKHPKRNCIYNEIDVCNILKKEKKTKLFLIKKFLLSQNYPKNNGLVATGFIFREHNKKNITLLMKYITNLLLKYTTRDQLIFNYSMWKLKQNYESLNIDIFTNKYFYLINHKNYKVSFISKLKLYVYNIFTIKWLSLIKITSLKIIKIMNI